MCPSVSALKATCRCHLNTPVEAGAILFYVVAITLEVGSHKNTGQSTLQRSCLELGGGVNLKKE